MPWQHVTDAILMDALIDFGISSGLDKPQQAVKGHESYGGVVRGGHKDNMAIEVSVVGRYER